MIIARSKSDDKELFILGLSARNIELLQKHRPILLREETHGAGVPKGWEIFIMAGDTEADLKKTLEEAGVIGPDTIVHLDPRLGISGDT